MWTDFQISALVPRGLALDSVNDSADSLILFARNQRRPSVRFAE